MPKRSRVHGLVQLFPRFISSSSLRSFSVSSFNSFHACATIYFITISVIKEYIDKDLDFDYSRYQDAIINNTDSRVNSESIKNRVRAESVNSYDFWEICRGHDLVKVLQYVFSSGKDCLNYGHSSFDEKELSRFLRGSYEEQWFIRTSMYINLKNWQSRNHVELLDVV